MKFMPRGWKSGVPSHPDHDLLYLSDAAENTSAPFWFRMWCVIRILWHPIQRAKMPIARHWY
jgi:hypothetical protein